MKTVLAAFDNGTAGEMLDDLKRMHEEALKRDQSFREAIPAGFDRSVADDHSLDHKKYLLSLADRSETEAEKFMKCIYKMRARLAVELEDERIQKEIRKIVEGKAEEMGWDAEKENRQVGASKTFLLDVFQDDIMRSCGELAVGKHAHHNDANMMLFMQAFIPAINDPRIRKQMMKACKESLKSEGYATHDLDAMEKAMGSMPRLRAVAKRNDDGTVRSFGLRCHGIYSETWAIVKDAHRERIDEAVKGIVGRTELEKDIMGDLIELAGKEVKGMLPGARGDHFVRELRRLQDNVQMEWGIGLDPSRIVKPDEDLGIRSDLMEQRNMGVRPS